MQASDQKDIKAFETKEEKLEKFCGFFNVVGEQKKIVIDHYKLVDRLKELGFVSYEEKDKHMYLHVKDNVCRQVEQRHIIGYFIKYIEKYPAKKLIKGVHKGKLLTQITRGANSYFAPTVLNLMTKDKTIKFKKHTAKSAFYYYKNGFVEVTKDGVEFKKYKKLKGVIWKNQILNRKYDPKAEYKDFSFFKFCNNIAGNRAGDDLERFQSLKSVIGYLLHIYFNTKMKAIVFTDSRISIDDEPRGRSGKSLISEAIGLMLDPDKDNPSVFCNIDAKKIDKNQFAMQQVSHEAMLVCFNDIKRNFDIEYFFNDILNGLSVEKKGQQRFTVKVKMIFSTNRLLKIKGDSAKDRFIEFELADVYSALFSPLDEFKQWFFSGWNREQWASFDAFMLHCVQYYLQNGLSSPSSINLYARKLREETHPIFVTWITDFFERVEEDKDYDFDKVLEGKEKKYKKLNPLFGKAYDKKELFETFQIDTNDYKKMRQNTFTTWLKAYADYTENIKGYVERQSNGNYLIEFLPYENEEDIPF